MAIAFISNAADLGNNNGASSSLTVSFTSSVQASILEISVIASTDLNPITYAGNTPSGGSTFQPTGTRYISKYYFNNPPSGANNFVISAADGNPHYLAAVAVEYQGTTWAASPDATASDDSGGVQVTTMTTSITTVSDNAWAVLTECQEAIGPPTSDTGATLRITDATYNEVAVFDSNGAITPAGNYSMTYDLGGLGTTGSLIFSYAPSTAWGGSGSFAGGALFGSAPRQVFRTNPASFSGAGSFAVLTRQVFRTNPASFAGAGLLAERDRQQSGVAGTFAGIGAFNGLPTIPVPDAASFSGSGAFHEFDVLDAVGGASFGGTGAFNEIDSKVAVARGSFVGAGTVTALTAQTFVTAASFVGTGVVSEVDSAVRGAAAQFFGVGTLAELDTIYPGLTVFGSAAFAGVGALSSISSLVAAAGAGLIGLGSFAGAASGRFPGAAAFAAAGSLSAATTFKAVAAAGFSGAGTFGVTEAAVSAGYAAFSGAGHFFLAQLVGTVWQGSAGFLGSGLLSPAVSLQATAQAQFFGSGAFSGAASGTVPVVIPPIQQWKPEPPYLPWGANQVFVVNDDKLVFKRRDS